MTRYEYDEYDEASEAWRMDVVHEVDDSPAPVSRWVDAMRRLNAIDDPLAPKLLALHRDCGSGSGVCDAAENDADPMDRRSSWGCETTRVIADHFGVESLTPHAAPEFVGRIIAGEDPLEPGPRATRWRSIVSIRFARRTRCRARRGR